MILRSHHTDLPGHAETTPQRLNLLLSCGSWRTNTAVDQLPRLLNPMGISSYRVESGEEAEEVIRTYQIHIAVVDMAIPLTTRRENRPGDSGGTRIVKLLRRLHKPPPMVLVRPPQPQMKESGRGLTVALREGVFAVIDRPLEIESVLKVMRRIVERHYDDSWPES